MVVVMVVAVAAVVFGWQKVDFHFEKLKLKMEIMSQLRSIRA